MKNANSYTSNKVSRTKRLPYALLAGFTAGFMFFFFGVLDIFAGNRRELLFAFGDFGAYIALIALAAMLAIALIIFILPKKASDIVFSVVVWLCVMGYIQATFLNGAGSLSGDTSQSVDVGFAIIDGAVWVITGVLSVIGALQMNKKEIIRTVFTVILIMLCVMQITGCAMEANDIFSSPFEYIATTEKTDEASTQTNTSAVSSSAASTSAEQTEATSTSDESTPGEPNINTPDLSKTYLTTEGLTEVSNGKNVIVFIIDRFDVSYYEDIMDTTPDFFDKLRGFTYFSDNVSLYSRTYPGVTSMITGVDNDFSGKASDYFNTAYTSSGFLKDLKANNYKVKLYTAGYYAYTNGAPLYGIADNLSIATDYTVTHTAALVGNMIALSAYRYMPTALKPMINISTSSFTGLVEYNGDAPLYELNDPEVYSAISENGLSFDDSENSYILIHLNGCHDPYIMDADGNAVEKSSVLEQLRGCFNLIYNYIGELKRLGVYDDSTIIITGDHPRARDDAAIPSQPRLTALFAKPSGASDEPLKHSTAQVSQANLIPTIVKSAGIETATDYGLSYFDITPEMSVKRYHKFELYVKGKDDLIVTFEVEGDGTDFDNWTIVSEDPVGLIYRQ